MVFFNLAPVAVNNCDLLADILIAPASRARILQIVYFTVTEYRARNALFHFARPVRIGASLIIIPRCFFVAATGRAAALAAFRALPPARRRCERGLIAH